VTPMRWNVTRIEFACIIGSLYLAIGTLPRR
jgi:hypothetical protein